MPEAANGHKRLRKNKGASANSDEDDEVYIPQASKHVELEESEEEAP